MSAKVILTVVVLGIGLPAFIFYSIFLGGPAPEMKPTANFENHREAISNLRSPLYQVIGVVDEGGSIRVNVQLQNPSPERLEARIQALNTLYDVQSAVGQELSVSVWTYASPTAERSALQGLAFYRALTGRTIFRHPDDLR